VSCPFSTRFVHGPCQQGGPCKTFTRTLAAWEMESNTSARVGLLRCAVCSVAHDIAVLFGRLNACAFDENGALHVADLWESVEAMNVFVNGRLVLPCRARDPSRPSGCFQGTTSNHIRWRNPIPEPQSDSGAVAFPAQFHVGGNTRFRAHADHPETRGSVPGIPRWVAANVPMAASTMPFVTQSHQS
jgi:hypothetical protein